MEVVTLGTKRRGGEGAKKKGGTAAAHPALHVTAAHAPGGRQREVPREAEAEEFSAPRRELGEAGSRPPPASLAALSQRQGPGHLLLQRSSRTLLPAPPRYTVTARKKKKTLPLGLRNFISLLAF